MNAPVKSAARPVRARTFSIAITGSGGSGVVTAGMILLEAAAKSGLQGLMTRSAGPQIRGGESAAMLRLGQDAVTCLDDRFDVLLGLDWLNVNRFVDEIPIGESSLIITDEDAGVVPDELTASRAHVQRLPFKKQAASVQGGRLNMVALGALSALCGLSQEALGAAVRGVLAAKGSAVIEAALTCAELGFRSITKPHVNVPCLASRVGELWNMSGNEACGLGALRGGVRFVAAYPITPASELLEWLAPRLEQLGGSLLQAEDELASINMIVGASFGGVPALTATSGPGLSLMTEGLGLAVVSETPVVVVDVMRGGPSTGIPTKSEQSDLNIAIYGLHGDAPHLVLAPLDIPDCAFTTQWAVRLAEQLQSLAVVLSDQSLGQARTITAPPPSFTGLLQRALETMPGKDYRRYALTDDGYSPMTLPGVPAGMYTADGLEHNERGTPSSMAADHIAQLEKRRRKIEAFDFGEHWAEVRGSGELCLVTWGSSSGATFEAAERLRESGHGVRVIALRLLAPLRHEELSRIVAGAAHTWVIEQNHGGQLFHYLKAYGALPRNAESLARPGPLPLRPGELVASISQRV